MRTSAFVGLGLLGLMGGILFEAGAPLLRLWARDLGGVSLSSLGWFSAINLLYTLKFLWSPLLVGGKTWGRQEAVGFFLLAGACCIGCLALMKFSPTLSNPGFWVCFALFTVFRASYDMLVVASQADAFPRSYWGLTENISVNGYRLGIMGFSALALILVEKGFSWNWVYGGIALTLLMGGSLFFSFSSLSSFLRVSTLPKDTTFYQKITAPFIAWLKTKGWLFILVIMLFFRIQDGFIDPMRDIFHLESGFSKQQIVLITKTAGLWMTLLGGILSGVILRRKSFFPVLVLGLFLHMFSGLGMMILSLQKFSFLSAMILNALEQTTKGFTMIAFFSFQLSCCNPSYAVPQVAILTAIASLGIECPGIVAGYLVEKIGWTPYLSMASLSSLIPIVLLMVFMPRYFPSKPTSSS